MVGYNINVIDNATNDIVKQENEQISRWTKYINTLQQIQRDSNVIFASNSAFKLNRDMTVTITIDSSNNDIGENIVDKNIFLVYDKDDLDSQREIDSYIIDDDIVNMLNNEKATEYFDIEDRLGTVSSYKDKSIVVKLNNTNELNAKKAKLKIPNRFYGKIVNVGDVTNQRRRSLAIEHIKKNVSVDIYRPLLLCDNVDVIKNIPQIHKESIVISKYLDRTLNDKQREAVRMAIATNTGVSLIQGPPGTGKTTVIAEICYQNAIRGKKTLIASESNLAIDNAISRLRYSKEVLPLREGNDDRVDEIGKKYIEDNIVDTLIKGSIDASTKTINAISQIQNSSEEITKLCNSCYFYYKELFTHIFYYILNCINDTYNKQHEVNQCLNFLGRVYKEYIDQQSSIKKWQTTERTFLEEKRRFVNSQIDFIKDNIDSFKFDDISSNKCEQRVDPDINIDEQYLFNIVCQIKIYKAQLRVNECTNKFITENDVRNVYQKAKYIIYNEDKIKNTLINSIYDTMICSVQKGLDEIGKDRSEYANKRNAEYIKLSETVNKCIHYIQSHINSTNSLTLLCENCSNDNNDAAILKEMCDRVINTNSQIDQIIHYKGSSEQNTRTNQESMLLMLKFEYEEMHFYDEALLNTYKDLNDEYLVCYNDNYDEILKQAQNLARAIGYSYDANEDISSILQNITNVNIKQLNAKYKLLSEWRDSIKLLDNNSDIIDDLKRTVIQHANVVAITCQQSAGKDFAQKYQDEDIMFDTIIIDEVSKCILPELAMPSKFGKSLILIGDHKQLPPMVDDIDNVDEDIQNMVKQSVFKTLFENIEPSHKIMLNVQYRMHSQIMNVINCFYDNKLACGTENEDITKAHHVTTRYINENNHVIWIDTPHESKYYEEVSGTSKFNIKEVSIVKKVLLDIDNGLSQKSTVSVISFYGAQVDAIYKEIKKVKYKNIDTPKVSTVDRFQGVESEIVIVSTVRNNSYRDIGFAKSFERINVAFSRAQKLLIIVGSLDMFTNSKSLKGNDVYNKIKKTIDKYDGIIQAGEI